MKKTLIFAFTLTAALTPTVLAAGPVTLTEAQMDTITAGGSAGGIQTAMQTDTITAGGNAGGIQPDGVTLSGAKLGTSVDIEAGVEPFGAKLGVGVDIEAGVGSPTTSGAKLGAGVEIEA